MDHRDHRIFAYLMGRPFDSWSQVGATLGITGSAVRKRIRRLEDQGVFHGFRVLPAAETLSRHPQAIRFSPEDPADGMVQQALTVDPVVWATRNHDDTFHALLYTNEPDAPPPQALTDLFGCQPQRSTVARVPVPKTQDTDLSRLDWRLLEALIPNPRRPATELGEVADTTRHAATERRDRMLAQGLIHVAAQLDVARGSDGVVYHATVRVDDPATLAKVEQAVPEAIPYGRVEAPLGMLLYGQADRELDALDSIWRIREIEGVTDAQVTIPVESRCATDRLVGWASEQASKLEQSARG